MKKTISINKMLLITGILFLFMMLQLHTATQVPHDVFLRIDITPNITQLLKSHIFIKPVVQMKGYIIATGIKKQLEKYTENSLEYKILSDLRKDYSYYLVRYSAPETLTKMQTIGKIVPLEPGMLLFAYKNKSKVPVLPRDTMIMALNLEKAKISRLVSRKLPRISTKLQPNPDISDIIAKVSQAQFKNNIEKLQNFVTRYYDRTGCKLAADYIHDYFNSLGLQTEFQSFMTYDITSRNVIATQPGSADPDSIVIIGGHYDSDSYNLDNAPGADDNATAVSAAMEAARILRHYEFDFTIKYIAFAAEEIGLMGSNHYATTAAIRDEKIVGVVNLDMISYVDIVPEDLNIISNESSQWLGDLFASSAETYTTIHANNIVNPSVIYSDHSPFWLQNYPAILAIEDFPVTNPYYHSPGDRVETLTLSFGTEATKAAIANVIMLAQLYNSDLPKPPNNITLRVALSNSLFDTKKHVLISWNANNANVAGFNIYRTTTGHTNYTKLNTEPITATSYEDKYLQADSINYYVVTAVSNNNLESHFSAEVSDDNN